MGALEELAGALKSLLRAPQDTNSAHYMANTRSTPRRRPSRPSNVANIAANSSSRPDGSFRSPWDYCQKKSRLRKGDTMRGQTPSERVHIDENSPTGQRKHPRALHVAEIRGSVRLTGKRTRPSHARNTPKIRDTRPIASFLLASVTLIGKDTLQRIYHSLSIRELYPVSASFIKKSTLHKMFVINAPTFNIKLTRRIKSLRTKTTSPPYGQLKLAHSTL